MRRRVDAVPVVEGGETAFVYFVSERIAFSAAVLPPGERSSRDPGHPGAHEVVYCVRGRVELEFDDIDTVVLDAGDAALIYEGVPHTVFNPGTQPTEMIWSAAPSLGRPITLTDEQSSVGET